MKRAMILVGVLFVAVMGSRCGAEAEKESPYLWKSKVHSVTVFKNGLGFFLRQGKTALSDGWCLSDAIPPASFGTLAVYSHNKDEIVDILGTGPGEVLTFDDGDDAGALETKRLRIESLKYLKLQITYRQQGSEHTAAGQLVSVGPDYVVLEAERNTFAAPLAGIQKVQVLEKPLRVHVASDNGKPPAETTVGMAYLRKGITWIPEYTLTLHDEETGELSLRGTLVNEAEDMIHCDVNFVVGTPHFLHTDFLAPAAVGQVIRTIGAAVAPQEVMKQMMNRAAVASDAKTDQAGIVEQPAATAGRDLKESVGNLPQWEGAGGGDFTVYTRKDLTLRLGEKAVVTLFVNPIRYSHLYRWSPPNEIEHFLVLQNDTETAWTTGPCLVISGGKALSEDLLKYVPKGGNGEMPVASAINITHDQKEAEVDRKLKAHQPSKDFYLDLVTIEGTLSLQHFGKMPAELVIDLNVPGKAVTASDNGKISLDSTKLKLQERASTLQWRIPLNVGESKTLTYRYERYVPSQ
jgi:hypothetical protein